MLSDEQRKTLNAVSQLEQFLRSLQETDQLMLLAKTRLDRMVKVARIRDDKNIEEGILALSRRHEDLAKKQVTFNRYIIGLMNRFGLIKEQPVIQPDLPETGPHPWTPTDIAGYVRSGDLSGAYLAAGLIGLGFATIAAYIYSHRTAVIKHARATELAEKELGLLKEGKINAETWLTNRLGPRKAADIFLDYLPIIVLGGAVIAGSYIYRNLRAA